jgi:integrase/recombinase XerD
MVLHRYLTEVRSNLVKVETDHLVITGRGTPEKSEGIQYLVSTFRKHFPDKRLTPMTIRQSVIALKLKQRQGLRLVQVFAGHRQPSTTEQYRANRLEELKAAVQKYHPLQ